MANRRLEQAGEGGHRLGGLLRDLRALRGSTLDEPCDLVRSFPGSENRLRTVTSAIDESYRTNRLGFRGMPGAALTWDRWGLDGDPREYNWTTAVSMDLAGVQAFAERFKTLPFTITVVGDKEKVDLEALARFGEVREVTKDELFNF